MTRHVHRDGAGHIPRLTDDQRRILAYLEECANAELRPNLDDIQPPIATEDAERAIACLMAFGLVEPA